MLEKWKKIYEKDKLEEIEFCRKHPRLWKIGTFFFILFIFPFVVLFCYSAFKGDFIGFTGMIFTIIFAIWILEMMLDRYREAFPKLS